jgi:hypothetical protein
MPTRRLGALGRACVHCIGKYVFCRLAVVAVCLVMLARQAAAAAGSREVRGGASIHSAVHPRYLGHVADEPVERDVPATMRDEPQYAGRSRG